MNTLVEFIVKRRKILFVFLVISLTILLATFKLPGYNGNLDGLDNKDNSEYVKLKLTDSLFSNAQKFYFIIEPKTDNRKKIFNNIDSLTEELKELYPGAEFVSPVKFYKKMIRVWDKQSDKLSDFYKQAREVPLLDQLIARDGKSFICILSVSENNSIKLNNLDDLVNSYSNSEMNVRIISELHLNKSIEKSISFDIALISILILALFIIYLLATFRSIVAILYMIVLISLVMSSAILVFSLLNYKINVISIIALPVILILVLSDSIHLLSGTHKFSKVTDDIERNKLIYGKYIIPSFFSSLTTAFAFLSFYLFSESQFVKELGLVTAIGLMVEFLITFIASPFLLYRFRTINLRDKSIESVASFLDKYKRPITYVLGIVAVSSLFIIPSLKLKTDPDIYFPMGSQVKKDYNYLKKNYFTPYTVNVLVSNEADNKTELERSKVYNFTRELSSKLQKSKETKSVTSSAQEYYFKSNAGFKVNLFSNLGKNNPYYNYEFDVYLIEAQLENIDQTASFVSSLEKIKVPENIKVSAASKYIMFDEVDRSMSTAVLNSLMLSGLGIFVILLLLTRSVKIAIVSLLPNLIPLGFIVLLFYFLDINVNLLTSLTLIIGLGLLDDDTIHIIYRRLWLNEPLEELKFSVLSTALLLSSSFLIFAVSSFQPMRIFGVITAIIFLIGVTSELTVFKWIIDSVIGKKKHSFFNECFNSFKK